MPNDRHIQHNITCPCTYSKCMSYIGKTASIEFGTCHIQPFDFHITVELMRHMARWQSESFYLLYAHLQAMSEVAKNESGIVLHTTAQSVMFHVLCKMTQQIISWNWIAKQCIPWSGTVSILVINRKAHL